VGRASPRYEDLPDTPFDDAIMLANELERKVRAQNIPHEISTVGPVVTVSVGLATRTLDSVGDAVQLVGLADAQLYQAKQNGRGRACGAILGAVARG
jgi:diguanylate cyclase (GGDEF)-like protein